MKKTPLFLFCLILFFFSQQSTAQEISPKNGWQGQITVIANPAYYFLGGYHIKPSYHFRNHWSVGITAQGGFEVPDFARDQFFDHDNDDLKIDWTYAIGAEIKYRFSEASYDKGWYTAVNLGSEGWEANDTNGTDTFANWFTSVDLGYNWYPFQKQRLHFGAQYTLIFILNNTDNRQAGNTNYNINTVVPPGLIPNLFIGWRF